jgi:hypothetical protein
LSTTATASSSKLHKIFTKRGQKSVHRLREEGGKEGSGGMKKARTENNKPVAGENMKCEKNEETNSM